MIKFTDHYWRSIFSRYTIEKFVVIKQPVKRNKISFSYLRIEKMYLKNVPLMRLVIKLTHKTSNHLLRGHLLR